MINNFYSLLKYPDLIFCDNAGGTQIPKQVISRVNNFLENNYVQPFYNNILSNKLKSDLNEIRETTKIILNIKEGNIVYGNSATQLAYTLANSLTINNYDKVILTEFAHSAMVTPFIRRFNHVDFWNFTEISRIEYNNLIDKIDHTTSLVVLPHVSNVLGNIIDIKYLSTLIKEKNKNTKILVDGVAYMPHGIIDIDSYNIDYYIVSFYKFYGLRISAMYLTDDCLKHVVNQNNMIFDSNEYDINPSKLQLGGINYETVISILGIKDYLLEFYSTYKNLDINKITFTRNVFIETMMITKKYETSLVKLFRDSLSYNKEIEIIEDSTKSKVPIFALKFKNYNVKNINIVLNNLGILSNVGKFYCDFLLKEDILRISLAIYNSLESVKYITHILNIFTKKYSNFDFAKINKVENIDHLASLQNTFNYINQDVYYTNERFRAFSMLYIDNLDNIKIIGNMGFYQSQNYNNYNGDVYREYDNISTDVIENLLFKYYISVFRDKIILDYSYIPEYINVHQIRVVFDKQQYSTVVPEGIHRDGYNIIMIICINRHNVKGGVNNIYRNDKTLLYSTTLFNSEAIIINDNKLLHDVSWLSRDNQDEIGYRDIFVLTSIC
tara:strand:+ start:95 stop:1927 length:1833 start_codon:yes stop_codon:yes gene_type:complete